jgi:pyruvate/2-oxoglutarate dehydrogenase complex dihydrolipoamide dehydrogenase (E3) component
MSNHGGKSMKEYDVIVIGAGTGLSIAFKAQASKLKVALIDKGNVGGTCQGRFPDQGAA